MTVRLPILIALAVLLALTLGVGCAAPRAARTAIDWNAEESQAWSVHIVTEDETGRPRVTRIWHVQLDDGAAIRTGESRWWKNIKRGSSVYLRVGGVDYPVRVQPVVDAGLRERIDLAFAEKYGWQERLVIGENRAASDDHYMLLESAGR